MIPSLLRNCSVSQHSVLLPELSRLLSRFFCAGGFPLRPRRFPCGAALGRFALDMNIAVPRRDSSATPPCRRIGRRVTTIFIAWSIGRCTLPCASCHGWAVSASASFNRNFVMSLGVDRRLQARGSGNFWMLMFAVFVRISARGVTVFGASGLNSVSCFSAILRHADIHSQSRTS